LAFLALRVAIKGVVSREFAKEGQVSKALEAEMFYARYVKIFSAPREY
jgi:hypothetical protein